MSAIDLPRIAHLARDFLDQARRIGELRCDPWFDFDVVSTAEQEILFAAQALTLALDGRQSIFDSPVRAEQPLGINIRIYGKDQERRTQSLAAIEVRVIRNVVPRLIYCIGHHHPIPAGHGATRENYENLCRTWGFPSVADVEMRATNGGRELEALARAVNALEELASSLP
jgi:hypothetical protein